MELWQNPARFAFSKVCGEIAAANWCCEDRPKTMRNRARLALLFTLLLLAAAGSSFAQSANDFYLGLLTRGASYVEAGQYDAAVTPLRIAAFGLVENVSSYENALVYLAIAQDRTGNLEGARDAVRRLAAAERIERKFGSLQLAATIRSSFLDVAKKHLSPADTNALASGGAITSAPPKTTPPATTRPAPASAQQQQQQPQTTKPQPQPQATNPAPAQSKPAETKPAPAPQTAPAQSTQSQSTQSQSTQSQTTQSPAQQPKKPEPKLTEPKPAEPKPSVPQTTTSAPPAVKPPAQQPPASTNTPATNAPAPAPVQTKPALSAKDVAAKIAAGERALTNAQLADARRLYRELLDTPGVDRDSLLRVVEGLYRARDFAGALAAFKALGPLRKGEEPYGYYYAVALYETGAYEQARKTLAAALPFIEMTPDVVRYRAKIEGAR
jgi:hypothetical protein